VNRISNISSIGNPDVLARKLLLWAQQYEEVVFLESNAPNQYERQPYGSFDLLLAVGAQFSIETGYREAFEKLRDFQNTHNDYIFGYLGYDLKNDVEELSSRNEDHLEFSDLYFFIPQKLFVLRGNELEQLYLKDLTMQMEIDLKEIYRCESVVTTSSNNPSISPRINRKAYFEKVGHILDHIHRGDIYEVNFCQEFYADNAVLDPVAVYHKLNDISRAPFSSYLKLSDRYLLSASPERFVKKIKNKVIVQPIKGTARRIDDQEEDVLLAKSLANDPKERAENIMIVDLIRNDLSKHAQKGSVDVEELCKVYSFKQVHQLISTVVCETSADVQPVDILKDLFPMGSMTGAPKISAMKIIEEEEETKRGLYSGAVGYFTPSGDFDFSVVIRSILYNRAARYASISVGSAITAMSVIENEYEECLLKAKALKQALSS